MNLIVIKKKWIVAFILIIISIIYYIKSNQPVTTSLYLPITNRVIVIDPGHGGIDPGAVGKQGQKEDDINLAIALKLKRLIEQTGGIALLTREEDKGLYTEKSKTYRQKKNEDLKNRKKIVNSSDGDIFISIHLNSFPQSKYYGAQTFYKKGCEDSKKLAEIIQEELRNVLDKNNRRVPQQRDNIYLLREANMPSVLIECGFLSNPKEERLLSDSRYQEKIAWAIYIGIMRYFKEVKNE